MKQPLVALAALALAAPSQARDTPEPPAPTSIVAAAPAADWRAIDPADLLVMTLAPDRDGNPRQVTIQLMPAPFSQGWVGNVRTLAKAHWWDGTTVYRVVDNWVAQWGDGEDDEAKAKPLPEGLRVVPESEYVATDRPVTDRSIQTTRRPATGFPEYAEMPTPDETCFSGRPSGRARATTTIRRICRLLAEGGPIPLASEDEHRLRWPDPLLRLGRRRPRPLARHRHRRRALRRSSATPRASSTATSRSSAG